MKYITSTLLFTAIVAGHGYVRNATIGDTEHTFYQPYEDPYMDPKPARISREIRGNGYVADVAISDIQCGGYATGGINGSRPIWPSALILVAINGCPSHRVLDL